MIKNLLPKNSHFLYAAVLIGSCCLGACSKEQTPAPVPAQQAKTAAASTAPAVSAPKPIQSQTSSSLRLSPRAVNQFDFSNKKDPFKPFIVIKADPNSSPGSKSRNLRSALPIHSYDISQFKLIGIIVGARESKAMVTDPGGKGYVLKVGMLIGKSEGKVTTIDSHGVTVLEQFKDDNGKVRREYIKLTLPRKQ
ncbi:MAG: pilus assembly protein PilP [Desulfuromonadaceae bacterium]|nr:pilus assembly protein PilP [Desulfuromonadaceae bacterium]MDD5105321.1 pilus assembly protein PilP [Desulfuromonadaceae bacterium]